MSCREVPELARKEGPGKHVACEAEIERLPMSMAGGQGSGSCRRLETDEHRPDGQQHRGGGLAGRDRVGRALSLVVAPMIASDLRHGVEQLGEMIAAAKLIVPFTGAGISTESGIPDFRSPGGLWSRNRPIDFEEFLASQDARDESWRRRFAMEATFAQAKPTRGHRALASLYRAGKIPAVITQNIDNLHQASGFAAEDVIELHGNTTYARCIGCGQRYELSWVKQRFEPDGAAPDCTICNEPVKTATVSFGQAMPEAEMHRATELAQRSDLFVAIGSSLVVWPAAGFPLMAKEAGAKLVIINREPTDQDDVADLVLRYDIGETLGPFVAN
jgi:NAD-dependent deacetylase